jgi:3,4-dihydroxy 2-butanone 4-phosphate synthase/GTP cyclohydrolase II
VVYLRPEGIGDGLNQRLLAIRRAARDAGGAASDAPDLVDPLAPHKREFGIGSQILRDLGLRKIRILTNNPKKIYGIEGYGLTVVEELPLRVKAGEHNQAYLKTKKHKLGHRL